MSRVKTVLSFGEILWDISSSGSHIGGAPFNFCGHLAQLGTQSYLMSCIGDDPLGQETLDCVNRLGVRGDFLTVSHGDPTGRCIVSTSADGFPQYDLRAGMAYDHITISSEQLNRLEKDSFDALYFGTLIQRDPISRSALQKLVDSVSFPTVFCDLNIREGCYSRESVIFCLEHATILKISREEHHVLSQLGIVSLPEESSVLSYFHVLCRDLSMRFSIPTILITLDKDGALVFDAHSDRILVSQKPDGNVVSTVGAGDSFSAGFLHSRLQGDSLENCLRKAVVLSSYVVTREEAIPPYPPALLRQLQGF